MMKPSIHINGTSAGELLEQHLKATIALRKAIDAVRAGCPNGRDYYPQGAEATGVAMQEHAERIVKLTSVLSDIEAIGEHVLGHSDL